MFVRKTVLLFYFAVVLLVAAYPQMKRDNIGSSNAYSNLSQGEKDSLLWEICGKEDTGEREDAMFSLLLHAGANVNFVPEDNGWNLLYETMNSQNGRFLTRLIKAGCDVHTLWMTSNDGVKKPGLSLVEFAIDRNIDFTLIRTLVDAGADIKTCTGNEHDIVYYAIQKNYPIDEITFFLEKGAPAFYGTAADTKPDESDLPHEPVNLACAKGNADLVHLLERYGADVRIQGGPYGSSLNAAAAGGNIELVKYCVDRGIPFKGKDSEGYNALGYAVATGNHEIAGYLSSRGADIDAVFGNGNTLLFNVLESATWGISDNERRADLSVAYDALQLGADPLFKNDHGKNALSVAMRKTVDMYSSMYNQLQYIKFARFILSGLAGTSYRMSACEASLMNDAEALRGALPDFDGTKGESPFVYAFASGKADCLDILYEAGLRPSANDVIYGMWSGNFDAVDRCIKNGFDVNGNVDDKYNNIISYCENHFYNSDSALIRIYSFIYENGFDVSKRILWNGTDWTQLAYFAHRMNKGKDGLLPIILSYGAGVNEHFGKDSQTALMSSMSNYESFMFLKDSGANLYEKDASGYTVFDLCGRSDTNYTVRSYLRSIKESQGVDEDETD